jgi:plastocyanin
MTPTRSRLATVLALALASAPVAATAAPPSPDGRGWLGEEMPLPLAVRTAQDLALKAAAEKQYLIFNLLAGGKLAWDAGDYAAAAAKWDALLKVQGLDPEIDRLVRPIAQTAHERAGKGPPPPAAGAPPPATPPAEPAAPVAEESPATPRALPATASVSGTVSGGGAQGPGGAVLWLKRIGGATPRPVPARGKIVSQRGKAFLPHVLVVPVGTKVSFRNDDPLFHNVFSLSKPNEFDTGLYKQGGSYTATFRHPGLVQVLCNIHSSMLGFIYVVDTPYYTQADGSGAFTIRGVPPGDYELFGWHEAASKPVEQRLSVGAGGLHGVAVTVGGDKRPPQFLPDKSGKPRQSHLGY